MTTKTTPDLRTVTFDEMLSILLNVEKGTICNCKIVTDPKMTLGGRNHDNQFIGRVKKVTNGSFTCGNSYTDRVRNEMKKQGLNPNDYVPEPSKVGEHVSKCVTYNSNTGNYQFQMEYHEETKPKSVYLIDGNEISYSNPIDMEMYRSFEKYLIKHQPSKKQMILGIEDTVNLFSPSVQNIKEITINHVRYIQE
jgi:hypothetical protein